MTWKRVATAAVLIPIVVALVLYTSTAIVALVIALVMLLALFEYFALGDAMRFVRYRFGGGVVGNVGANTLTVLKSSIPYVSTVTNLRAATGGLDAESLEAAKMRAPATLRSQERAVTAEDFEFLALEADRTVARARCIQVRRDGRGSSVPPGTIELLKDVWMQKRQKQHTLYRVSSLRWCDDSIAFLQ